MTQVLNIAGLLLTLGGVIVLFRYGMPTRSGLVALTTSSLNKITRMRLRWKSGATCSAYVAFDQFGLHGLDELQTMH